MHKRIRLCQRASTKHYFQIIRQSDFAYHLQCRGIDSRYESTTNPSTWDTSILYLKIFWFLCESVIAYHCLSKLTTLFENGTGNLDSISQQMG